jgi:outer membrane receptor protein involved in Fe transport
MRNPTTFRCALACVALVAGATAGAQSTRAVRGRVIDVERRTPVADVRVHLIGMSGADRVSEDAVLTSPTGTFGLRTPTRVADADTLRIVATRLGFAPETVVVRPDEIDLTVRLRALPLRLAAVTVAGEQSFTIASSSTMRDLDIRLRPRASSQELLALAPGLVIAQHAGGGKAEQIFLRGFDADHGTDVAVSVDGTPVNMVSHAHGQGYADLHFLIPEVVERVDVRKGPFDARDGDFATAGSVSLVTRDRVVNGLVAARASSFATNELVALLPFGADAAHSGGYAAVAGRSARGPFVASQDFARRNVFAKWTAPLAGGLQLVASASGFTADWSASGQVPERAVRSGLIPRFGALDPTEGGATSRYDAGVGLRFSGSDGAAWETRAFATRYRLRLFSNFTFFLADTVEGDGIEQYDDRVVLGLDARYATTPGAALGRRLAWSIGAGVRSDGADVALHHQTQRRRLGARLDDRISQQHLYTWQQADVRLAPVVRFQLGMRGDLFRFGVRDQLAGGVETGGNEAAAQLPHVSGVAWQGILSPKANLAVELTPATTLFASAATGFHSNDARDVLLARAKGDAAPRVVPRAVGTELGGRHGWPGGSIAAALWLLDLQSELVYVGDEGTTEPSGRTRRVGLDLEARARLAPWLWADADLNLARGRFRDAPTGEDRVPLAPTVTSAGGLTVRDAGPFGAGIRYRYVGPRAADERATVMAHGAAVCELAASWRRGRTIVTATVDNFFDREWNEAQFATTSRLRSEPTPVTELHFTPGTPRRVQLGVEYRF